ncbi:alanine--tRNA ligase [Candidatus Annandia pinicola]|uniref:alanine--tRNA ligase n=1 Tax=Candidatus Annandia pinicola TaxID=1345117 RepID=UPI001D00CF09|nr:alanine--tRNA ligase [Candidatus Annandia pinicola]UDG80426.1 Alanine--tRNA ligase [Candidatus Annandia pinicola]
MQKAIHEVRKMFINFFINKNHKFVKSSSLIPYNDSTLLFTNAGMNQFKNIFLGNFKDINFNKVVTSQRCLRVGGKHNDLNNIGFNKYHNTFFEMLGNFSFGDYFKKQAIIYAWELLTGNNFFNLNPDKFIITVYYKDIESYKIWLKDVGISNNNILKIYNDKKKINISSNFWQMDSTGPCGPCTEIFYNFNNDKIKYHLLTNDKYLNNNYVEIWNIVFMQFNKLIDGSLLKLNKPSVDTGMGLERITSILQNVKSSYNIDIFNLIINEIKKLFNNLLLNDKFLYIISDHIRSCIFLIYDGVLPSNEGRGYVLRRIIRRGMQQGYIIKYYNSFLYKLVKPTINIMKLLYPYLKKKEKYITEVIKKEENNFIKTLGNGLKILNEKLKKVNNNILDGKTVFNLYDTFGFPLDLTSEICNNYKISIDYNEYKKEMLKQKKRSKNDKFKIKNNINYKIPNSLFNGYNINRCISKIKYIIINNISKKKAYFGEKCVIFLDKTPFYAESGGQIGDIGYIKNKNFFFEVQDTQKYKKSIGHIGIIKFGKIIINDNCITNIDIKRRNDICINHSSTHLLYKSLKKNLNKNITQEGSLIKNNYFNFDFKYKKKISDEDIINIEKLFNYYIKKNFFIINSYKKIDIIKNKKIFINNYKYDKNIRLVNIGNISKELCCGTHIKNTKEICMFIIMSKNKKSKNIYRIKAITGKYALKYMIEKKNEIKKISEKLKININEVNKKIDFIIKNNKKYKKIIKELQKEKIKNEINLIKHKSKTINNYKIIISKINVDYKFSKKVIDYIKKILNYKIIVLIFNNKSNLFLKIYIDDFIKDKINYEFIINNFYKKYKKNIFKDNILICKNGIFLKKINLKLNKIENIILKKLLDKK